jgi:ferrochelatase
MRYWHPLTEETVRAVLTGGFSNILLLPLYPQFSKATTNSSFHEWDRLAKKAGLSLPTQRVCCYPDHPLLIETFAGSITTALRRFPQPEQVHLVFSAHGVPVRYIQQGDPYQLQVEETMRCILQRGGWSNPHTLCFQSKVGPVQWLTPSLLDTIRRLADAGTKEMLVIPIAFVTDHIETLHEINIDAREKALAAGIHQFELTPALNGQATFIECLYDLALKHMTNSIQARTCSRLSENHPERPNPRLCPFCSND